MAWAVEYIPERRWVVFVATSEIEEEDGKAQVEEVVRVLNEHKSALLLLDCSGAVSNASLPSVYRMPDYATALGAPWNLRTAVVVPKTPIRIELFQFFELVCRNAGYEIRLFDDRHSAEAWLRQPPVIRNRAPQFAAA
jgi:hypothetical protein